MANSTPKESSQSPKRSRTVNGRQRQRKNPTKDRYLAFQITPEDKATAVERNRADCLIACGIARVRPDATRIVVNTKMIAFTLEDSIDQPTRYYFHTEEVIKQEVLKPFDTGHVDDIPDGYQITLVNPYASEPKQHKTQAERVKQRNMQRLQSRKPSRTKNVAVKQLYRYNAQGEEITLDGS